VRRRQFIALLGSAAAFPVAARAQHATKIPRIGIIDDTPIWRSFRQALRQLGYVEGQNIAYEYRYGDGVPERLATVAAELVRRPVDVIATFGTPPTRAAKEATASIPIVMVGVGDPVRAGLVASLARPGGNITGLSTLAGTEISSKHLELLKEVMPNLGHVAVLSNPTFSTSALLLNALQTSAPALGLSLQIVEARQPDELEPAVAAAVTQHAMALVVILDPMFLAQREQLAELVAKYRLPAIYGIEEHVTAGGLMAYAASRPEIFRRAATFVDKILKGAKPADLPVEQPTKFLLIINLKTAKALGLAIPDKLLAVADEVIE